MSLVGRVLGVLFGKYVAVVVLAFLLLATGFALYSWAVTPDVSSFNERQLAKVDRGAKDFTFIVLGDNRNNPEVFKSILARVNEEKPLFVLHGGDTVQTGTMSNYREFFDLLAGSNVPMLTVIGNHETKAGGLKNYERLFGSRYYSFAVGDSYFIVLDDSNEERLDDHQEMWLLHQIVKSRQYKYRFVAMHVPLYDSRTTGERLEHAISDKQTSRWLNDIFDRYGVTMLFTSHIHEYERGVWGRTPYIITGGAGAKFAGKDDPERYKFHYIKVHVGPKGITYDVVKVPGEPGVEVGKVSPFWDEARGALVSYYYPLILPLSIVYFVAFALSVLERRRRAPRRGGAGD